MSDNIDINEPIEYTDTEGNVHTFQPVSQMIAEEVTPESDPVEYQKDVDGVTNPNLHRRIDSEKTDEYTLVVRSKHSYRTVRRSDVSQQTEDQVDQEIP